MKQNEQEIEYLKEEINAMWKLVISQLEKAKHAFLNNDVETALEIIKTEKRVNAFDLKMDSSCERYIVLYHPVAIDLRLALSIMKISVTLERIGDYAVGIAHHVTDEDCAAFTEKMKEQLEIEQMFDILLNMLTENLVAFNLENSKNSGKILNQDRKVNKIFRKSLQQLTEVVHQDPQWALCALKTIVLLKRMERIGDHCSNIVEEIVFYLDAKVLKHRDKKGNKKS